MAPRARPGQQPCPELSRFSRLSRLRWHSPGTDQASIRSTLTRVTGYVTWNSRKPPGKLGPFRTQTNAEASKMSNDPGWHIHAVLTDLLTEVRRLRQLAEKIAGPQAK